MKTYTFNRAQLVAAFVKWETAHRAGETVSHEEAAQLSVEDNAQKSADALIRHLGADNDFPLGAACDLSGEGGCEACQ